MPDWHCELLLQVWPFGSWHVEHEQELPHETDGNALVPLQLAEQVLPAQVTCAPLQTVPEPHWRLHVPVPH